MDLQLREYLISAYNATPEWQPNQPTWFHQVYFPDVDLYVCAGGYVLNTLYMYLRDELDSLPIIMEDIRNHEGVEWTNYEHQLTCSPENLEAEVKRGHELGIYISCDGYISRAHPDDEIGYERIPTLPLIKNMELWNVDRVTDSNRYLRTYRYCISTQECKKWLRANPPVIGESQADYRQRAHADLGPRNLPSLWSCMLDCMYPSDD